MPAPLEINLTQAEREELETVRDTHPKAYMRERAAAILKSLFRSAGEACYNPQSEPSSAVLRKTRSTERDL